MNDTFEAYIDGIDINELGPNEYAPMLKISITSVISKEVAEALQNLEKHGRVLNITIEG